MRHLALRAPICALICAASLGAAKMAAAADAGTDPDASFVPPEYRLSSAPLALHPAPGLANVAALGNRPEFLVSVPASFGFDTLGSVAPDEIGNLLDRTRATVRYTWLAHPGWDVKVGLSTMVDPGSSWQRFSTPAYDHLRMGNLPTMHLLGERRLADRWMLSLSADGLHTTRGQALDMDLRIDYSISRDVALFGSYRLSDSSGDGPEVYGFLPSNSARFGVRLRF
jgi:hypothetical protein